MVFVEFRRSLVIVYMRFNSSPLFAVSSCGIMLCHVAEADDVRDIVRSALWRGFVAFALPGPAVSPPA